MLHQESSYYHSSQTDYFASNTNVASNGTNNKKKKVTPSDRQTMSTWSYDIVDACSIDREVACIAISYTDRFLSTNLPLANECLTSRRTYQLVFITCLIIALKCRAGMTVDSDFVADVICQGMYEEEEIVEMEKQVLSGLEWRLNGPSVQEFVSGLIELLPRDVVANDENDTVGRLKTMANIQAELILLDYEMGRYKSSVIAYAAVLSSLQCITAREMNHLDRLTWMQQIELVMGMKLNDAVVSRVRDEMVQVVQRDLLKMSTRSTSESQVDDIATRRKKEDDTMHCSTVVSASSMDSSERDDSEGQLSLDDISFSMDDSTSSLESFSDMTI